MKDDKLVLISGSGRGLGASIAESFANKGYKCLCGSIHKFCYRYCQTYAKTKTMRADQIKIDSYVMMSEFDDEDAETFNGDEYE